MDITEEEFERMMYNYEIGRLNEEYMKTTISSMKLINKKNYTLEDLLDGLSE